SKVIDKNLCFATAASNALTWWLDQNSDNIDKFLIKNPYYKKAEELKAINYYNGQYDSGVYKHLLKQYAWRETGYWSDILYDHFINGYKPKKGGGTNTSIEDAEKLLKEGPEIVNGGFFYDVFGTNLLSTRRGYGWDYAGLGPWLKENILAGNSILLDYYVGRQSHMITVWGVEFNENGKLTGVFISDSDDQKQYGMMRYRIVEHHGAPFLTTNTRGPGSVRVDSITTLSLGQKYWDEYFGESKQVEKVTLNKTELNLETGKEETLKATITPETTPNKEVVWSSDNEKVATVNQNGKVVAVGQGNATITVTTKDGNKTSTCKVRVKRKIVNPPINSDGSNGEIVTPPQVQIEFIDTKGHWAENTIKLFIDKGYINGYDDKTFKPNNSITRAEFVKVVNKLFGYIEKGTEKFYDVNENDWFYNDICIGIKAGYIKGKSETIFSPNDKITRQEVAMILTNIMNNKDENLDKLNSFKDGNETPQWAQSSVEGAIEAGYLNGYEDNTIKAFGNTTRAEAVTMLSRVKK
ncbi:MAG: IdeS/Mac family cysteine endopeptidase, partial [Cetobacterium sp.]|nr:IdeS/Mac family cysteine endopeptidase [Cetobacterium sp.]